MLTRKDLLLISKDYFVILNQNAYYIEFMSKRTGHCWIIYKHGSAEKYPVWLYHKHSQKDQCYHLQRKKNFVDTAIKEIKAHDRYQRSGRKREFENLC